MAGSALGTETDDLAPYVPTSLRNLSDPQTSLPRLAKDVAALGEIEQAVRQIPTSHHLLCRDARDLAPLASESVHLIVTSPPYWTLKEYSPSEGQLGDVEDYEQFLVELDKVWSECYRVLVPGGRLICVVGDVLLARRRNGGRHAVMPLHASIQEHCRRLGYDNLAPIIWAKIGNARYEAGGRGFLGKPFEPNAIIKNDIEYILFQRKHGGYRSPTISARILSVISSTNHQAWFQQIWTGLTGEPTKRHPAPYPLELAERLVRMYSFVGDTVLDPFSGTGTTSTAAAKWGRDSFAIEVNSAYMRLAEERLRNSEGLWGPMQITVEGLHLHH